MEIRGFEPAVFCGRSGTLVTMVVTVTFGSARGIGYLVFRQPGRSAVMKTPMLFFST